jgi:beta-glucosidase
VARIPERFLWGVATAAYQIEGAVDEDGRGPSVWDTFCHAPGKIRDGHTGDVACDHYHRWREDVGLIAGLGAGAYRFSIAWPRIQPDGRGLVNAAGLDFYDRLVDALAERGVAACPTLFHWDLPQPLEDNGGWLDRDTAYRFADYAAVVAERIGDRARMWITLNEPYIVMALGYGLGMHAPGRTLLLGALPAAHHQLLGHGLAVAALRDHGAGEVAITNAYSPTEPETDSAADVTAAAAYDTLMNRVFTDPVLLGRYPDLSAFPDADLSFVRDGDLKVISAPIDALGVNYYFPTRLRTLPDSPLPFEMCAYPEAPATAFGWPVVPEGLHRLLGLLRDRYPGLPPIYVTENGCSYDDMPDAAGRVADPDRIAYLDGHIKAVRQAMDDGIDVRGYFVWSLLDNFEWSEGYHQRFGLVHVDYATQRRTPKSSYAWYRDLIADGRAG